MWPTARSGVDTEETFHFFNARAVLSTNEIRSVEDERERASSVYRARRRRLSSIHSARDRRNRRRRSSSWRSALGEREEDFEYDDEDDDEDYIDDDDEGYSDLEEDIAYADVPEFEDDADKEGGSDNAWKDDLEGAYSDWVRVSGGEHAENLTYEKVYDPFWDLYARRATGTVGEQNRQVAKAHLQRERKARRAIAAFSRRMQAANAYQYWKQSEFMRVCYYRALEADSESSCSSESATSAGNANPTSEGDSQNAEPSLPLISCSYKGDAISSSVPDLHPRKWPHLPSRHPAEWNGNDEAALEFLTKLVELPDESLLYEPIDVNEFVSEIDNILQDKPSQDSAGDVATAKLNAVIALVAMGTHLQSFSLLTHAALQCARLGDDGSIGDGVLPPRLKDLAIRYCSRLEQYASGPALSATFPRHVTGQWKITAYQPSTSDAIATDGQYLYIFGRNGLLKIGTGNGTTVRDFVYQQNKKYTRSRDAERSWLCCIGKYLYCRTIITPGHRVDRISTDDLNVIDELFFAPNHTLIGKGVSETSVYAMVSNGIDLFTVKCIDTRKSVMPVRPRRRMKEPSAETKTGDDRAVTEANGSEEGVVINIGDRVVRGPDWKWSNQDGENGNLGTVVRISTWGGVKGSGVTVRWDTNQRVNTYRWGAEGCYDLIIVIEENGIVVDRKPLPSAPSTKQGEEAAASHDDATLPRHQFVLYRHDVNKLVSIVDLTDEDIDMFLDLEPSSNGRRDLVELTVDTDPVVSALHSHTVSLSTSKTSWMCDGRLASCLGDNASKRYRCDSGCDYDLCESCLMSTVISQSDSAFSPEATDSPSSPEAKPVEETAEAVVNDVEQGSTTESTLPASDTPAAETTPGSPDGNPFADFHSSLFEDKSETRRGTVEESTSQKSEAELLDEMATFWCGFYSRTECQIALRRNGYALNEAAEWLHTCGHELRKKMLLPADGGVVLTTKSKTGALDPVLLIAGTFYASQGQLCIVSPPGLYTIQDNESDKAKRTANSCDASWFFSLESGHLITDTPMLLKGVPAGSPTCVDSQNDRILVFSGYLNCLESYSNRGHDTHFASRGAIHDEQNVKTVMDIGELIFAHVSRLIQRRGLLPAYKHVRAGLQDILFRVEREPIAIGDAQNAGRDKIGSSSITAKSRRIKKIRARLKEVDRLNVPDKLGYFVPFCVDFQEEGFLELMEALLYYHDCLFTGESKPRRSPQCIEVYSYLLLVLAETLREFEFVGVTLTPAATELARSSFAKIEQVLVDVASGVMFEEQSVMRWSGTTRSVRSRITLSAQFILAWGIQRRVFCSSSPSGFFEQTCERLVSRVDRSLMNEKAPKLAISNLQKPFGALTLETEDDCIISMLRCLLYSSRDDGRVTMDDFVPVDMPEFSRVLSGLFKLARYEVANAATLETDISSTLYQTPIIKALHSVMNHCSAKLFKSAASQPIPGQEGETFDPASLFELFASVCFDAAIDVIEMAGLSLGSLRTSIVGSILPLVVATASNFPARFSESFSAKLLKVLEKVDATIASAKFSPDNELSDSSDSGVHSEFVGRSEVVETPHPYNQTQPAFRRVVHVPGATVLHFTFDPRCRTASEADFVLISPGVAWFQTDRMPSVDGRIGESGGCFYGSYLQGTWPATGFTIPGDTATVMLCSTTQTRDSRNSDEGRRWGLKCSVQGLHLKTDDSWYTELGNQIAHCCSSFGSHLIRSFPPQSIESVCQPLSDVRKLWEPESGWASQSIDWGLANEIVECSGRGTSVMATISTFSRLRKVGPRSTNPGWDDALQAAAAVLVVRSDQSLVSRWVDSVGSGLEMVRDVEVQLFQPIAAELDKLEQWMLRQVQLLNEWHYLCEDRVSMDDLMERYADNSDRVQDLCRLKNVPFKKNDVAGCIKELHIRLETESGDDLELPVENQRSMSHRAVADEILVKTRYLLERWKGCRTSTDKQPGDLLEPMGRQQPSDQTTSVGDFLRSTTPVSCFDQCGEVQTRRLEQRLSGIKLMTSALSSLKSSNLRKFFIGRGSCITAIDRESSALSGCIMATPDLLSEASHHFAIYADTMERIVLTPEVDTLTQAVALVEYYNFSRPSGAVSSTARGFDRVSQLISSFGVGPCEEPPATTNRVQATVLDATSQVYELLWILLRVLSDEIQDLREASDSARLVELSEEISRVYRTLYSRFLTESLAEDTQGSGSIAPAVGMRMRRLLCAQSRRLHMLRADEDDLRWWLEAAINLIVSPTVPVYLGISGVRFLRVAFDIFGDKLFTLECRVLGEKSKTEAMVLDRDLQRVLLKRLGNMVSLEGDLATKGGSQQDVAPPANCCVLVFLSDAAHDKLAEAIEKVREPDIDSLMTVVSNNTSDSEPIQAPTEAPSANPNLVHRNVRCDGCNQSPLCGFRFKCFVCQNYDLCTTCYTQDIHNTDHAFVRLADSTGMGDLLQPRSKGGGIIPESSLIGSKQWKGSLFRALLDVNGYAVYQRGPQSECLTTATALAGLGMLTTIVDEADLKDLEQTEDWESQVTLTLEPGVARMNRRSSASQKSGQQKATRELINAFNRKGRAPNMKGYGDNRRQIQDPRDLASEIIAFLRGMLSSHNVSVACRDRATKRIADILSNAPKLLEESPRSQSSLQDQLYITMGTATMLGAFHEHLRIGASVAKRQPDRLSSTNEANGIVFSYKFGNEDLTVYLSESATAVASAELETGLNCVPVSDVDVVPEVQIDAETISKLECLASTYCAIVGKIYQLTTQAAAESKSTLTGLIRSEVAQALMLAFSCMVPSWPTLFDNQLISTSGNAPALLFQLAQMCSRDVKLDSVVEQRESVWMMEAIRSRHLQYSLATQPLAKSSGEGSSDSVLVLEPSSPPSDVDQSSTEYVYNLYAYSSRADLPQHSGRNKMLEYWEKNVIPAIETYVAGSFKSYEMDYFFAQLREPLREGNSAAALKIAFTLCDGHVPSGCHYPDPDTDWSALQQDDLEIGEHYLISTDRMDAAGWPDEMLWTVGHVGSVRVVNPSGMALLQVLNPMSLTTEYWWYHVNHLRVCSLTDSIRKRSITDFESSKQTLCAVNTQMVYCLARKSIFDLMQVAPEHVAVLSLNKLGPASLPSGDILNHYSLTNLLKLAANSDLGCPDRALGSELGHTPTDLINQEMYLRAGVSHKKSLIGVLQLVLNKQFDRANSRPALPSRSISYDDGASLAAVKRQKKRGKLTKQGSKQIPPASTSVVASSHSKLQPPDVEPITLSVKYRFMLMEALLRELRASLDASGTFLQHSSFTVTSDTPPKPVVLVHVPDATCLILSFIVHPVMMDLPAGSSLEVFRDERCTDRIFGYFGEKRGLNYLPPLVVPGDRCYVRVLQGAYARYKFRVSALTPDFGLSMWLSEEIYQKLATVPFSGYEVETILTNLLNAIVQYLVDVPTLPTSVKSVVVQLTSKLVNFALVKGALHAVPIGKLSGLVKELMLLYDNERTTQNGLYSLFTQQLAELVSLVEEVSSLKGGSSAILSTAWWADFVRIAAFTRVLVQGKREIATPDAFQRIYCGRAPIREIEVAHEALSNNDFFAQRLVFLQKLPRTDRVGDLETAISRFIRHLSLEECGEADDQNVYSAADTTRFGIISKVLYLPVDAEGFTKGFAIVDVGRQDITSNLLSRVGKATFEFDGEPTASDNDLVQRIDESTRLVTSSAEGDGSSGVEQQGNQDGQVWTCSVCTLENQIADSECAACGSPIPLELANVAREAQAQASSGQTESTAESGSPPSEAGWSCTACTFVNNWAQTNCEACSQARDPSLVPPAVQGEESAEGVAADDQAVDDASDSSHHSLHALSFTDILQVARDGEVPEQLREFLVHWFTCSKSATDEEISASVGYSALIEHEMAQASASASSKAVESGFASIVGIDSPEQPLAKWKAQAVSIARENPLGVYKWMRLAGYDLQFELNHYPSSESAKQAQQKWTHQMDCQLISVCKDLSAKIGMLTLAELCPSFLRASKHLHDQPLLANLETRDLRLRFVVLKTMNRILLEALPLVNLRPSTDPSSLRNRVISSRQLIFPDVKIKFFTQAQDNVTASYASLVDSNSKRPMVTLDRRKILGRRGATDCALTLDDPKRSLFACTMSQLRSLNPSSLRAKRPTGASDPFVSFIVIFAGENVVGEGGPYRQLFNDVSNELLSPGANPLFIPTQNNVNRIGEYRERYIPRPSSKSKELLQMFEHVGLLMGCSLRTGVRLNIRLAPIVWKMLVKQSLVFADLESVDWSMCESLRFLEVAASAEDLASDEVLYDSFTSTLSDGSVIELKPNGSNIPVTKDNCKEYVRLVKSARLQECKPQVDALLRGIGKIVPVQLLQLCVWSELQQWICGSLEIDLELLKRHTRYSSGMTPAQFPHLEMFWAVLGSLSEENKRRFINFAWGQDTLPADDAEFDRTHTRLLIKAPTGNVSNQDELLPKADTCFFNIELPAYSTEEIMREKLLLAITMCTSLDGDDQSGHLDMYYAGDEMDDDRME